MPWVPSQKVALPYVYFSVADFVHVPWVFRGGDLVCGWSATDPALRWSHQFAANSAGGECLFANETHVVAVEATSRSAGSKFVCLLRESGAVAWEKKHAFRVERGAFARRGQSLLTLASRKDRSAAVYEIELTSGQAAGEVPLPLGAEFIETLGNEIFVGGGAGVFAVGGKGNPEKVLEGAICELRAHGDDLYATRWWPDDRRACELVRWNHSRRAITGRVDLPDSVGRPIVAHPMPLDGADLVGLRCGQSAGIAAVELSTGRTVWSWGVGEREVGHAVVTPRGVVASTTDAEGAAETVVFDACTGRLRAAPSSRKLMACLFWSGDTLVVNHASSLEAYVWRDP